MPQEKMQMPSHQSLACACGQVRLTATGQPIATVECCCESCRKAGSMLRQLLSVPWTG